MFLCLLNFCLIFLCFVQYYAYYFHILLLACTAEGNLCVFLNVLVVALVLLMIGYRLFSLYWSCVLGAVLSVILKKLS